jgi:hypothetical protein
MPSKRSFCRYMCLAILILAGAGAAFAGGGKNAPKINYNQGLTGPGHCD